MPRFLALATAALLLSSCATIVEKPTQDLTIKIVGTGEALCDVVQPGRRYRAYAPSTIKIRKSEDLLNIRCFAPGNREKTVVLEPTLSHAIIGNVATGVVPGMAWDYQSGAMYEYPDVVVMDFSAMPPQPYDLPDYQKVLNENPHIIGVEEFRPGKAALMRDMGHPALTMQMRPADADMESQSVITAEPLAEATAPAGSSGMNADSLTRTMNPGIFSKAPEEDK